MDPKLNEKGLTFLRRWIDEEVKTAEDVTEKHIDTMKLLCEDMGKAFEEFVVGGDGDTEAEAKAKAAEEEAAAQKAAEKATAEAAEQKAAEQKAATEADALAEMRTQVDQIGKDLEVEREGRKTLERKMTERPLVTRTRPQFPLDHHLLTRAAGDRTNGNDGDGELDRLLGHDKEMVGKVRDLQAINDDLVFMSAITSRHPRSFKHWNRWVESRGDWGQFVSEYKGFAPTLAEDIVPQHLKATLTTTTGADYIPTILSGEFIRVMRHGLSAAAAIRQIDMPAKNLSLPAEGADVVVYPAGETVSITQADTDDRKVDLGAVDIKALSCYTDDIAEDSIIPVLALHREKHQTGMAEGIEFAVIHGDANDTQGQSSNTTMTQYHMYSAWDGLHAQAISATTAEIAVGGARWDGRDALDQINALDTYAQEGQCCWLMHPVQWSSSRLMVDYASTGYYNLIMVPGGNVSPITGMPVDDILGFPVIKSGQVCKNLCSTGYYDGASVDRTVVYLLNHRAFILGDRRSITVELDKTISTGVITIVTTWRGDMACLYASTADCISAAINIDYDA